MIKSSSTTLTTRKLPSDSDFKTEPSDLRETFNPTFGLLNEDNSTNTIGFTGGMFSPVEDEEDLTMTMGNELTTTASIRLFEKLLSSKEWSSPASFDVNLTNNFIQKYSSDESFLKKDLRFSSLENKYDLFYFNFSKIKDEYKKYCIANTLSKSKPVSLGFLSGINEKLKDEIELFGFRVISSSKDKDLFFIKKNDLNKISHIEILDKNKVIKKAEFLCDIAQSRDEKIAGLQVYKNLKYGSGLIFPYDKPQDVMYHMGTVSFPIDIIFIDSDRRVKKIAKNIQPGTLGTYGSSNISMVLEISGGASNNLGIAVGDLVKASTATDGVIKQFNSKYDALSENQQYYIKHASFSKKISFLNFNILNITKDQDNVSGILKIASTQDILAIKEASFYNLNTLFDSDYGNLLVNKLGTKKNISVVNFVEGKEIFDLEPTKKFGFSNFLAKNSFTPKEIRSLFFNIKNDLISGKKVVISSSIIDNRNILKTLFIKRAAEDLVFDNLIHSIDFVTSPVINEKIATSICKEKFNSKLTSYFELDIKKSAGLQIDENIIVIARKCLKLLESNQANLKKIVDKFINNSNEYLKIKDKPDTIKETKKEYNLSAGRISKDILIFLKEIKTIMSEMDKIKDISVIEQKIESLAVSCQSFVEIAEEIFELSNKIEEDNFVDLLSAETKKIEKSSEDVLNNLSNFSDYISKNILNKKVLSK